MRHTDLDQIIDAVLARIGVPAGLPNEDEEEESWTLEDIAQLRRGEIRKLPCEELGRLEWILRRAARSRGMILHKTRRSKGRWAHSYALLIPREQRMVCRAAADGYGLDVKDIARELI